MRLSPAVRGALIFDGEDPVYNYVGEAATGSSTAAAVWKIYRITNSGTASIRKHWADGNDLFDNVWDDRASLTYT